jgi:uncharacterized protein YbjT (DUF2867 family)
MIIDAERKKRVVIVGATGMVGGHALDYALDHPAISCVTVIGRRSLGIVHPKLKEVLHKDFAECSSIKDCLAGQDAAIFCLGTYTGTVSDEELRKITVDYVLEFARVLHSGSPGAVFSFLSGKGADPTEQSRMAFARYKGKAENGLLALNFRRTLIFRPAYIYPVKPRQEPNLSYRILRAIYPVFRILFPNLVIRSDLLAWIMVDVAASPFDVRGNLTLENSEIREMVESLYVREDNDQNE